VIIHRVRQYFNSLLSHYPHNKNSTLTNPLPLSRGMGLWTKTLHPKNPDTIHHLKLYYIPPSTHSSYELTHKVAVRRFNRDLSLQLFNQVSPGLLQCTCIGNTTPGTITDCTAPNHYPQTTVQTRRLLARYTIISFIVKRLSSWREH
jgi:hypothetical protein